MGQSVDYALGKSICVFGSARESLPIKYYALAQDITREAYHRYGYNTITGGGPGIMSAANRGAMLAGARSASATIELPFEAKSNHYVDTTFHFKKFGPRKSTLVRNSDVFIVMPGGFGTLDELFEVLTLIQCGVLSRPRKVILVSRDFWGGLVEWIDAKMRNVTISEYDMEMFTVVDTLEEVMGELE